MKTTNIYSRLEKTVYEFSESDILEALMAKIHSHPNDGEVTMTWNENVGHLEITVTQVFEIDEQVQS